MKANPVVNCLLILRSQAEYSADSQRVILRCMLEMPATGQRRGFTDVDALLAAIRAELGALQAQLTPPDAERGPTETKAAWAYAPKPECHTNRSRSCPARRPRQTQE